MSNILSSGEYTGGSDVGTEGIIGLGGGDFDWVKRG